MFSVMCMFTLNFLFCGDNDEFMCVLFCWRRTKKKYVGGGPLLLSNGWAAE